MNCDTSQFMQAFNCTRDDINNAYRRGLIDQKRIPAAIPGRPRQLDRSQAIELALALQLDRFGMAPRETQTLIQRHLSDCVAGKVAVLSFAEDAKSSMVANGDPQAILQKILPEFIEATGFRVINVRAILQRVDQICGANEPPATQKPAKRRKAR